MTDVELTILGSVNNQSKDSLVTMVPIPTTDMMDSINKDVETATVIYSSNVGV